MATNIYNDIIIRAAQDLGVPPDLALAISQKGEHYDPSNPESPKGAYGPMQVMPGTFSDMAGKLNIPDADLKNPVHNIYAGVAYLGEQLKKYENPVLAVAAYNSGPGAVDKYGGIPPYAETQKYVKNVLGNATGEGSLPIR
jgi:soluble lytic murein transglycosylase-like protein